MSGRGKTFLRLILGTEPEERQTENPLTEGYVRGSHVRMFDQTWKWAGIHRATEKIIGVPHHEIRETVGALLGGFATDWTIRSIQQTR